MTTLRRDLNNESTAALEAFRSQLSTSEAHKLSTIAELRAKLEASATAAADAVTALKQQHANELLEQEARLRGSWEEEKRAMQRQWTADEEARREAASLAAVAREREDAERNRQLSIERLEWMKERQKGEEGA